MSWEDFSLEDCLDYACREFGLENQHTIAIANILDTYHKGGMNKNNALLIARLLVKGGYDDMYFDAEAYCNEDDDGDWQVED